MRVQTTRVDLIKTRATWPEEGFQPAFVMSRRDDKKKWIVLDGPIVLDAPLSWADASADEYVRIPLFKYTLPAQGDLALAAIFQLGIACADQIGCGVEHLHIVTGNPAELVTAVDGKVTAMHYWFGFAVVLS